MHPSRREFLAAGALAAGLSAHLTAEEKKPATSLGIALASYAVRSRVEKDKGFNDPLKFLAFCKERGAGGVQVPIGAREDDYTKKLRTLVEDSGMFLEGSLRTPADRAEADRFEAELKTARAAGVSVVRTVMMNGRRYETFHKADDFREFHKKSLQSLALAEPIVARHKLRLAVENHKDYRTGELADLMKKLSSEHIGVCVDTGNNIALLDDALETVQTLAPWAFSCHLKDMAVEEYADGFLLSEVPLGEGSLDLKRVVEVLRGARKELRFCLEMITRDPLKIPCLAEGYWATFGDVAGRDLARTLAWVRKNRKERLPRIEGLPQTEQLDAEDRNVRESLDYARQKLPLG